MSASELWVRPASIEDAVDLGQIHAENLRNSLQAEIESPLPEAVTQLLDETQLTKQWAAAIADPPTEYNQIFVALLRSQVVGFVATSPIVDSETQLSASGVEILALAVKEGHTRQGHASRLLAGLVKKLRSLQVSNLRVWFVSGDQARINFFSSCGFAATSWQRTLDVAGSPLVEICWDTSLENSES